MEKREKKSNKIILNILKGLGIFLGSLILIFVIWMLYCNFQKTPQEKVLPKNYTAYIRTDSVWEAVEPLLDLKAADIVLSDPDFVQFRSTLLNIRESSFKENKLITKLLKRRIDAAVYDDNSFIAVIDMSYLSGLSRLLPIITKVYGVEGLSASKQGKFTYFSYSVNEQQTIFATICKNLVIITSSKNLLTQSTSLTNDIDYTEEEKNRLATKLDKPFRISANGKKIIELMGKENPLIQEIGSYINSDKLSSINFGISDDKIRINLEIPYYINENNQETPLGKILSQDSRIPTLLTKLPPSIQYYTLITAGSLSDLKDAFFQLMELNGKDYNNTWNSANSASKFLFNLTIDQLLFSWTGDEYAVLGLEEKANPVFVLKISDEEKRQQIFDTVLSSIILKSNNSLLLDGIRLPRLEMPDAISMLLEAFGLNLPKPYYMIRDNFIYFSQSPENLAEINASLKSGAKLGRDVKWTSVSDNHTPYSSLGLYYNLERSTPFFIQGTSLLSKILQLYNIGRVDIGISDNILEITLNCASINNVSIKEIPGYPIALENKNSTSLYKSNEQKSHMLFWIEENKLLKAFNTSSFELISIQIDDIQWCIPASKYVIEKTGGEIWAVSKSGTVYLYDKNLNLVTNQPIETHIDFTTGPVNYEDGIIACTSEDNIIYIDFNGSIKEFNLDLMNEIKSEPSVSDYCIAVYEKGFMGSIHMINNLQAENPFYDLLDVEGLSYGSPAILKVNNDYYTAIITQTGKCYIWNSDLKLVSGYPIQIDDIFYLNLKPCNNFLIALSEKGILYKIELNGNVTELKLPYLTAKTGVITVCDYDNDNSEDIFICGEANIIYGLNSDLEYLNNFPVAGYGSPVFQDINGDKLPECLTISIDNKLNAWKIN